MRYIRRILVTRAERAARYFPAMVLTGPRRAGKAILLRHLLPRADYYLLEGPVVFARDRLGSGAGQIAVSIHE